VPQRDRAPQPGVTGNVAGLEIENTQYADVYENHAEDNTGGIVVFDLPGNPIVGRDVRLRDNTIVRNNRRNFAPGGTVAEIPSGTGTFVMASRRVVVTNNTYEENNAVDIALISGLIIEGNPATWELDEAELVGTGTTSVCSPGRPPTRS
jgi:parallel beta-helix repeat protein